VLDHIRVASLRGRLSFLASDLLEGRDTPSRGLDIAAEYIAAGFRRAGLEAAGDAGSYFQTVPVIRAAAAAQEFRIAARDTVLSAAASDLRARAADPLTLTDAPVYKIDLADGAAMRALNAAELKGKVVLFELGPGQWDAEAALWTTLEHSEIAAVVVTGERGRGLIPAGEDVFVPAAERPLPAVSVTATEIIDFCQSLKAGGASNARMTLRIDIASRVEQTAKNVVAMLRGSDSSLNKTCVILSAHYDHLGVKKTPQGQRVFPGANDNGSGTVSMMEIAEALAAMPQPPRRSIVFAAFFGEEEGLYGSEYFVRHLPCGRQATIADVNLEQLGRTDTDKGKLADALAFTGRDYTTIARQFASAATLTGVSIAEHAEVGDDFFARSDNFSFATAGIPDHTVAIPAMFADYHAAGDTWDKIDYPNMARLDRAIALGLIRLADDAQAPEWNAQNPKTAGFRIVAIPQYSGTSKNNKIGQ